MATAVTQFRSINPATAEQIEVFDAMSESVLDGALDRAVRAAEVWRARPLPERCDALRRLALMLRRDQDVHAQTITAEMGKPITEARAEVEKCAFACEHFAERALRDLADEPAPSDSPNSFIRYEPLGVLLACMPWNFPYWQVFRCIAPALAAGNVIVLKHANNVTRCALRIETLIAQAGLPEGLLTTLVIPVETVADVIADPRVNAVSLTGSTAAGRSVATVAGQHIKKCVLELGGSDAFIVLDDADIDAAADVGVKSRYQNAGQSCIAAKRFIVLERVADDFERAFVRRARRIRIGDPTWEGTQMGPVARSDLRDNLERQLSDSTRQGAHVLTGGRRLELGGFYVEPTVITHCTLTMPAVVEETFGPLAAVIRVRDEDEAVRVANHTQYGLGGNVWTRDEERGLRVAARLRTGGVFINGMTHSDPRLPFGGVGDSGFGRELHRFGLHEFVNIKTIWRP